jgi:hypothetical protein
MAFQQMQCHNCNSNGISAKTKSLKMCRKCAENVLKMCHVYLLLHTKSNLPPAPPPLPSPGHCIAISCAWIHSKTATTNHFKNSVSACFLTPKPAAAVG